MSTQRSQTPAEERRLALIRTQRETTRVVKRTLIAIALIAGIYYVYLLKTQPQDEPDPGPAPAATSETNPT